jgi:hypothetical protein
VTCVSTSGKRRFFPARMKRQNVHATAELVFGFSVLRFGIAGFGAHQ